MTTPLFNETVASVLNGAPPEPATDATAMSDGPGGNVRGETTHFIARITSNHADASVLIGTALAVLTRQMGSGSTSVLTDTAGSTLARFCDLDPELASQQGNS